MKILAHRGYWNESIERNSPKALSTALKNGYGFESDIRDYDGKLVISHNIADEKAQNAEDVFKQLSEFNDKYCFAINIKADGLKELLANSLKKYNLKNYFLFDMSIPQMIEFRDAGLNFFTRQSEVEKELVLYDSASGIWIDGFWSNEWITEDLLRNHIENGKIVCLVSPDLHGRDYEAFWKQIEKYKIDFSKVYLCTDKPDEAKKIFVDKL